ncbi:MAG: tRNA (adenosine(37)-N6)-threonylcarbamoyltransferase complex ATPase subunit type 1 TsaE [Candidatus Pacebacteria bacterium]|nr:tRNA (adenosine(37)-N6)-threonylcarbamoyltransferase complex ATPase subunit type 1 TsaE [Candidatus Paceibacterota bacterium]
MSKRIEIISESSLKTKEIAKKIAIALTEKQFFKKALIIGLKGELGGGKTTFIQGFSQGLGIKEKILSPTFVIMKSFSMKKGGFKKLYHLDVYRINGVSELKALGLKQILLDKKNIVLIEWVDMIEKAIPKDSVTITFSFISENTRKIIIEMPDYIFNQLKMLQLDSYGRK